MEWDAQHQRADGEKAVIQDVEDHTRSLNRGLDRGEAGADDDKDDSYDDERKAGRAAPHPTPRPPHPCYIWHTVLVGNMFQFFD